MNFTQNHFFNHSFLRSRYKLNNFLRTTVIYPSLVLFLISFLVIVTETRKIVWFLSLLGKAEGFTQYIRF